MLEIGFQIFGMGQLLERQLRQLMLGVSEQLRKRPVHFQPPAINGNQRQPHRRIVHQPPIKLPVDLWFAYPCFHRRFAILDRKSVVSGKSVSVRLEIGGRRISTKKKKTDKHYIE